MARIDYDIYFEGGYYEQEDYGVASFVIVDATTEQEFDTGSVVVYQSTAMRIFIEGAISAMKRVPYGASVKFITDTTYMVNIINRKWKIKANGDLWDKFIQAAKIGGHKCSAEWRGQKQKDPILRRCWYTCSKVSGFDFIKFFEETYKKKHP